MFKGRQNTLQSFLLCATFRPHRKLSSAINGKSKYRPKLMQKSYHQLKTTSFYDFLCPIPNFSSSLTPNPAPFSSISYSPYFLMMDNIHRGVDFLLYNCWAQAGLGGIRKQRRKAIQIAMERWSGQRHTMNGNMAQCKDLEESEFHYLFQDSQISLFYNLH